MGEEPDCSHSWLPGVVSTCLLLLPTHHFAVTYCHRRHTAHWPSPTISTTYPSLGCQHNLPITCCQYNLPITCRQYNLPIGVAAPPQLTIARSPRPLLAQPTHHLTGPPIFRPPEAGGPLAIITTYPSLPDPRSCRPADLASLPTQQLSLRPERWAGEARRNLGKGGLTLSRS